MYFWCILWEKVSSTSHSSTILMQSIHQVDFQKNFSYGQIDEASLLHKNHSLKNKICWEQDGGRVGGQRVHLSPQIHQEYIFRHRSACRTPAERGQEYPTSGKEYIDPHRTRDQALSLWNGSTDSKTLYYQRTNPRGYQTVRTHTKEATAIQDPASANHQ